MDLIANLGLGLVTALSPINLVYCFVGALLGTLVGLLPGIGPTATMAMLLPFTYGLEPTSALIMLAGIFYGSQYGGSTTAILINVPGEVSSVVTAIEGHQMAKQGRAGPALAIAAIGSFVAGTIATFFIAIFAPALTSVALSFGPTEYFSLVLVGLMLSMVLSHGSVLKSLGMTVIGLLLSLVGSDLYTGSLRFTLGIPRLFNGIDFTIIVIGLFGLAEILRTLETAVGSDARISPIGSLTPSRADVKLSAAPVLRGTVIGSFLGLFPGSGATLAAISSYALEKKLAKDKSRFGRGAIEGVAGPESANNAAAQSSFIPLLTLGIPSNAVMALMAGAMMINGIVPGPNVMVERPYLIWGLIASMWIGNIMLLILNLPLIGLWVRLISVPYRLLFPAIVTFSTLAIFSVGGDAESLYLMVFIGLGGYFLMKLDCEPAPLLFGFVLGDLLEENFRRAMLISRGDPWVFFQRPVSLVFLIIAATMLVLALLPAISRRRAMLTEEG